MKDRIPYTYYLSWPTIDLHYYGVRYAKGCHPNDLWVKYKTSSKYVKEICKLHGDPNIIQVRKTFKLPADALYWEHKFLIKIKAVTKNNWINKSTGYGKFCNYGKITIPNYQNSMLGKAVFYDTEGNRIVCEVNDPRVISGEYKHMNSGKKKSDICKENLKGKKET